MSNLYPHCEPYRQSINLCITVSLCFLQKLYSFAKGYCHTGKAVIWCLCIHICIIHACNFRNLTKCETQRKGPQIPGYYWGNQLWRNIILYRLFIQMKHSIAAVTGPSVAMSKMFQSECVQVARRSCHAIFMCKAGKIICLKEYIDCHYWYWI